MINPYGKLLLDAADVITPSIIHTFLKLSVEKVSLGNYLQELNYTWQYIDQVNHHSQDSR